MKTMSKKQNHKSKMVDKFMNYHNVPFKLVLGHLNGYELCYVVEVVAVVVSKSLQPRHVHLRS